MNPLFPDEPTNTSPQPGSSGASYVLPPRQSAPLQPQAIAPGDTNNAAVELIRSKINALYDDEPNARQEIAEVKAVGTPRSRHQQFMHDLSTSGKSLAEIQTAWHAYYQQLSDIEKHEVWQEFYAANTRQSAYTKYTHQHAPQQPQPAPQQAVQLPHIAVPSGTPTPHTTAPQAHGPAHTEAVSHGHEVKHHIVVAEHLSPELPEDKRSFAAIKRQVVTRAQAGYNAQIKARQHLQSLVFGLGLGALVILILLFSFFNEMVIAPFIRPNAHAAATPIILSTDGVAPTDKNEVIIPKINVELPVIYSNSASDDDIENNLEDGVVHYPTTSLPGQGGNAAFFGHSSNNIFNKGQYKFAFVLLHELEQGDIFYITYNGKVYTYRVYQRKVVEPTEIGVLNPVADKQATVTLITCDPPGTSLHRLVVWGEQITPDPASNSTAPVQQTTMPTQLPSNSPSLWHRLTTWFRS